MGGVLLGLGSGCAKIAYQSDSCVWPCVREESCVKRFGVYETRNGTAGNVRADAGQLLIC